MKKLLRILLAVANVITGLSLLAGAFGGYFDPHVSTVPETFVLALPVTTVVMVAVLVLDLVWLRMWAVGATLLMMLCLPTIMEVFPLNGGPRRLTPVEQERSFTLMTYNVMNFVNVNADYTRDINPTLEEVMAADPDIVCMQEAEYFCALKKTCVTKAQIDSISARYPYTLMPKQTFMTMLSRYPLTLLADIKEPVMGGTDIVVVRADIHGEPVVIMSVHLQSIHYIPSDRIGEQVTELDRVLAASALRADRAKVLLEAVREYAPEGRLIICGDFNDVPGCYTLRLLARAGLHSVNTRVGHGYMPTYNTARKFFTIDHILYRGALEPVSLTRGSIRNSDHYPLTARFVIE